MIKTLKYNSNHTIEVIELKNEDVLAWKGDQSQAKLKQTGVKLASMMEIQARKGSKNLFYKTSHDQEEHCELDFLKKNLKKNQPGLPPHLHESFSHLKNIKTNLRSRVTDGRLNACMKLNLTTYEPDYKAISKTMQHQKSH
ncbi:hypothetical protein AAFF_G00400180 [Aldrovandia affinis]|uniref:Uncharacterized protein n=1 Tax=Aldrovandia affinis TaxID=143900 RepID=A0AAD7R3Y9_9TELE|nr:hypothetical protein AAFF_G00400180 [Aldrovandia affinis]